VYVSAVNQGQGKPLDHLAELTGKSPAAIKNHLWQATRKGLLERSPGRVGGKLTTEATKVLARIGLDGLETLAQTAEKIRETTSAVEGPPEVIDTGKPRRLRRKT
jgi:hypothetical protein